MANAMNVCKQKPRALPQVNVMVARALVKRYKAETDASSQR